MAAPALSSPQNLRYPEWQGEYQTALLELHQQTLLARVAAAETAILTRPQRLFSAQRDAVNARRSKILFGSYEFLKQRKCEGQMYISQVTERLALLKRELDEVKQMNLRYWSQSEHTALTTAAYESRRLRLRGIKNELAYMVKRVAA
jgi:uncharacterized protein YicC (UPF0701 family)